MKILKKIIYFFPIILSNVIFIIANMEKKQLVLQDIEMAIKSMNYIKISEDKNDIARLNILLSEHKPFRSIFCYRMGKGILVTVLKKTFGVYETIEIRSGADISGGFHIAHSMATINPEKIGKNCFIGQGVVIGYGKSIHNNEINSPIIGDNCYIGANAVIFNGIRIGNDVLIGAGAVVNKDVPDNSTVIGNPMKIL